MASTNDPRHESAEARERLSAIANELARRTTPAELKSAAKEALVEAKERVKEKAMDERDQLTDRVKERPALWGAALGAAAGLTAGLVARRFISRGDSGQRQRVPNRRVYTADYGYEPATISSPSSAESDSRTKEIGDAAREASQSAKEKIGEVQERLRAKIPSGQEVKNRAGDTLTTVGEHPLALAIASIGLGMLAARLVPETDVEREKLAALKERAYERIDDIGHNLEERMSGDVTEEEVDESEEDSFGTSGFESNETAFEPATTPTETSTLH